MVGNSHRIQRFIDLLLKGECTTTVVFGGSVSAGHNARGPAYHVTLAQWMNVRFPCQTGTLGTNNSHTIINLAQGAMDQQQAFEKINLVLDPLHRVDLILVKYNVNDDFIEDIPHAFGVRSAKDAKVDAVMW